METTLGKVHWRGVNHLALVTPDMDPTVRHYFIDIGDGNTIAFFEYADQHLDMYAKPAGVPFDKASQFDHLSLNLPDEEALLRLRDRLKSHDCEVTDVVDHGFIRSIYFSDPNGMALEASWWTLDATGRPADYADERLFADSDPVPAVTELRESGALDHTVSTR